MSVSMKNRFIKQIFLFFVLPALLLFLLSSFLLVKNWEISARIAVVALAVSCWVGYTWWIMLKVWQSVHSLEIAMDLLSSGKPFKGQNKEDGIFCQAFLTSLGEISQKMDQQRLEIQDERLRRLRSVIDGQDLERQRLSRELHDGIGQSLIAVKLQLENAGELTHSQMRASVDVAKGMIDQTIDEVRRVTNALLPAALSEFGLVTALRTRCDEMANAAGLKVTFEHKGSFDRLDDKSKTYLYRIAQEAITNAIKHARAGILSIQLTRSTNEVQLIVSDNGKGFIFDPVRFAHRNGLQNIKERVALLQGTFEIKTEPEAGTTLFVSIPYTTGNGKSTNYPG